MAGMLKFTCERCGHRIATPPSRLGRLVTCPECGHATHPLAGEILSQQGAKAKTVAATGDTPSSAVDRSCANCGVGIGRLQKLQLWDNEVVCTACHRALANEASRAGMRVEGLHSARAAPTRVAAQRRSGAAAEAATSTEQTALATRADLIELPAGVGPSLRTNALPYADVLRNAPLTPRGRLTLVLAAFCFLAAAVYGTLTLLRDLAGIIATGAFFLLALVCVYLVVRASVAAGNRLFARRGTAGKPETIAVRTTVPGKSAGE